MRYEVFGVEICGVEVGWGREMYGCGQGVRVRDRRERCVGG